MTTPLEVLGTLTIEDGRKWTEAAYPAQLEDALGVISGDPPYSFLTRSRGSSKTSDLAAVALALLLAAPSIERSYWMAADLDQGRLAIDAITGFLDREPALREAVIVTANAVEVKATGARLDIMASDTASSWGILPANVFVDELAQWSDSLGPRRLLDSVLSSAAKNPACRVCVLTTAGDPSHFSHTVLEHALASPLWRVHETPGPCPWMAEDRIAEQQARLTPALFAQLFQNVWCESEDRLVPNRNDLLACVSHDGFLPPEPGTNYVLGVDIGLVNDRTVIALGHRIGRTVVLDKLEVWTGSKDAPVQLENVEQAIVSTCKTYGRTRIILDPHQAVGLEQRLRAHGLSATQYAFTSTSVGRLATTLFNAIRGRNLRLIDDAELLDELLHVRLRKNASGTLRLDHDPSRHDDRAVALALAATVLLEDALVPVGYAQEIADIKERLRREARATRGKPFVTAEEELAAEHVNTEEAWSAPRGSWRDRLDGDLPTFR